MENNQYVNLKIADGTEMEAYTALPANLNGGKAPGLILLQEAFGVNHHIRDVAGSFAAQGYVVIAPELFHRSLPPHAEIAYDNFSAVMPVMQAMTAEGTIADLKAAYAWLEEHASVDAQNIFSIGYCMGGRVSFLANTTLPVKAGVSYYAGGIAGVADRAAYANGKHLFFWGGKDQHIKQDQVDTITKAMDEAGKDYINVKISYADHGFNCDARPSYNEKAAKEAWALTLAFLKNNEG